MDLHATFIGLGSMGSKMALNLLNNHVTLFVYNRTKDKTSELTQKGAQLLDSPAQAFLKAPIVFTMVANDHALRAITIGENGILANAKPGCLHVSMSTISPKLSAELAQTHKEKGVQYISAPVFGRPDAAAQHNLWICVAGESEAKMKATPFLNMMGKKIYDFGTTPESANVVKLTGNFLILSVVECLAEAFAFAEKSGIPRDQFNSFLSDSLFPSPVFKNYGSLLVSEEFEPAGFKMNLGLKDIDLLLQAADAIRVPLPVAGLLHDRLMTGLANHREEMD